MRSLSLELCASWIFKNKSPTKCVQVRVIGPWSLFNLPCPPCPQPDALKGASGGTIQDKSITVSRSVATVRQSPLQTASIILSPILHLEPNLVLTRVIFSFVWESN